MIQKIDSTTSKVPSECYVTHLFPQRLNVLVEDLCRLMKAIMHCLWAYRELS